ncbi:MAG: Glu-tRNA(Gln) amidotransferase subunit GatE [Planctomycetes bacterium]|nr:Glu-tRNA(Gln) amidotransferase subunit GatE [Planctomycetota bacterium]
MIEPLDYGAVGLISGLEVHQQLLTRRKLFCRCPAGLYTRTHDGEVLRHMRPTLSELGVYDGTALMEFKTKKEIVYLLNHDNVCTYEMDDTPPFLVDQEAIDVSIELCLLMHMDVIDEVHFARKQYLDGSIPTGFQRTAIVGVNGWLPFRGRRLTVTHVSVEEDSSREVMSKGHRIVFRTDRLGMPLTETVTGAELKSPEEVRDAILLAGLVSRSTRRVRTGIGAGREDVNVSVRGGDRVEIKGVSKAVYAVKLVHNEAVRQVNLLKIAADLRGRGIVADADVKMHEADVTDLFAGTEAGIARRAAASGGRVWAVRVEGVAGLSKHPTQPGLDFLHELEGRIRIIACLDEPPVVSDADRFPEFPGRDAVRQKVGARTGAGANDEVFLVWGPEADCRTAAEEIRLRFVDAALGVPKETRKSLVSGLTTFERILPGADRMYPDTDSPPTRVTADRVGQLRAGLAPAPWERAERYGVWGVPAETTDFLIRRGGAAIVDEVVKKTGAAGRTVAVEVGQGARALRRAGVPVERLGAAEWTAIFDLYTDARLPREWIRPVAAAVARNPGLKPATAASALGVDLKPAAAWQEALGAQPDGKYEVRAGDGPERRQRFMIGRARKVVGGTAPAREVAEHVRRSGSPVKVRP